MPGDTSIADLVQLIYSSRPFGFDEGILNRILVHARQSNTRGSITGALLCRRDIYLQLLEGPKAEVHDTFKRITKDDRHVEVKTRMSQSVTERMFANWAMLHEAEPAMWSESEINDCALDRAVPADFSAVFKTVAAKANQLAAT